MERPGGIDSRAVADDARLRNWAGNHAYGARTLHRPSSVEQVQEIVAGAREVRVLGSRHSFNDIADSSELIALDALPAGVSVDHAAGTVSLGAGLTYAALAGALAAGGVALHNLASLPHISVGGAIATGTHGSGDAGGSLATAVAGLDVVTSSGELVRVSRGDPDFDGMVVGLGAAGAVVRVTLDVQPAYEVRQRVYEGLGWAALLDHFDEVTASGDSVSVFTRWGEDAGQVWVKRRVSGAPEPAPGELFGAVSSTVERHPILGLDPVGCTPQLGRPGPWWDRLPHFRIGFTPSSGAELQSEYMVPRRHAPDAIEAVRALAAGIRPLLQVSEIRTVAADRLWMSPQHGRDTVAIHFTWHPAQEPVERLLHDVEAALAPFEARPHWGKLFVADAAAIGDLYERLPDYARLVGRIDPRGAFRNRWLSTHVLGGA
jgi:xylitol oxidase